ncbi:unnamed protein product [Caenorhabditis brenneri]
MTTRSKGSELLQTDQHAYRACILYEAICGTPVEDAYKRMKTVMPNVDFLNFEFFYYRFSNGNVDLDYDRSKDPKTRGFSDMPIEVVENIVGNLGLVDKLSTRKVCRNLRAVIDKQQTKFQNVSLEVLGKSCEIQFEDQEIEYSDQSKTALKDFSSVITHPKWSFENMEKLKIEAKSVDQVIDLIPIFDANILESIDFGDSEIEQDAMEKIFKMDQWKNARELKLREFQVYIQFPMESFQFPMKNLAHCKKFEITNQYFSENFLNIFIIDVRDFLFKSPTLEYCAFTFEHNMYDVPEERWEWFLEGDLENSYGVIDRVMGEHAAYDIDNRRYQIEGSDDYFEISFNPKGEHTIVLEIRRVRN